MINFKQFLKCCSKTLTNLNKNNFMNIKNLWKKVQSADSDSLYNSEMCQITIIVHVK